MKDTILKPEMVKVDFPENYYKKIRTDKKIIVLHHTAGRDDARSVIKWWQKDKYKSVATAYTIEDSGKIYNAFDASLYYAYAIYVNYKHNRLPSDVRYLKTKEQDVYLNKMAIQIEVCNAGGLKYKKGKFVSWFGTEIPEEKVVEYPEKYRGYRFFERYTAEEIESLKKLILYHNAVDGIPTQYNENMFDVCSDAVKGKPGIWSHTSFCSDKSDVHPQPELIEMLKNLALSK